MNWRSGWSSISSTAIGSAWTGSASSPSTSLPTRAAEGLSGSSRGGAWTLSPAASGPPTENGANVDAEPVVQPQDRLREAEARYGNLVEQLPTVVYVAPFGTEPWLYVSPQIDGLLGFTQEEWLTVPELWYRRLHPDDRDRVIAEEEHISRTGQPYSFEYRMLAKDGRVVWVHDDCRVLRDDHGRVLLGGTLADVTTLKQTEHWLLQAYEREHEAARQLHELSEMKTTFLSAVSHELR